MTDKEYHLFLYLPEYVKQWQITVDDVESAIEYGFPEIYTFQVVTCTTDLFRHGYRVFVHTSSDDEYEIKLGKNERTNREIRMWHCLYKLILSGEFEIKAESEND